MLGTHLFRATAFQFEMLYQCLGFSYSTSYIQLQGSALSQQVDIQSPPTTSHRTDLASLRVVSQAPRFNAASGSVATVVLWDGYACQLCDAPIQPTRCPLQPRELCNLVSLNCDEHFPAHNLCLVPSSIPLIKAII